MIKLVASDLDGTLLQGGAQQLAPHSIDLIHRLVQKGIRFVAASGRQYDNEVRVFSRLKTRFRILRKTAPSVSTTEKSSAALSLTKVWHPGSSMRSKRILPLRL